MLDLQRKGAGPVFDLLTVCRDLSISASEEQLTAFLVEDDGVYGSAHHITTQNIRFEISTKGIRHAREIENSREAKSLKGRLAAVPLGKSIWEVAKLALAAVFGAIAASHFGIGQ